MSFTPDFRHRAHLTERMDEPCSRDELRSCLRDISRLNRWFLAHRPLFHWLDAFVPPSTLRPLRILDVGCGWGDSLRRIERWAAKRNILVELTGLDINPDAVAIAAEASPPASRVRWVAADILQYAPGKPFHIVVSSLFTHHLLDRDIVRFLEWMERHAGLGWFINDLSRAAIPYHSLRVFVRLMRLHPFVQNDGPASIARAFQPSDWRRMCLAAGLAERDYTIHSFRPARLCVARMKS
jgi:2-polyprenyl-3-methyl-5-hydroxy-6-metoxy-1,4-benzoquinol methylase